MTNQTTQETKQLWCCGCGKDSTANLVSGKEIYPHRPDLATLPFWQCVKCKNFVGCHHKTKNPTKPLGCIPTPEIKKARQHIHAIIDPLWMPKDYNKRDLIYRIIADQLGRREYHTAKIKTIEEARQVYRIAQNLPKLLEERKARYKQIQNDYLAVKLIKNQFYTVNYDGELVDAKFIERKNSYCSLHGDLSHDYWFEKTDGKALVISIDAELTSLEQRTQEIKKYIWNKDL